MCLIIVTLGFLWSIGRAQESCPDFVTCRSSYGEDLCPAGTFYREKASVHGCCPGCLTLKEEGQPCDSSKECQPGLMCDSQKKCERDREQACEHYVRFDDVFKKTKYWSPRCLSDGSFAPKQCKGEKMSGKCFCVSKTGKRIFGEEEWAKAENMTCSCSRMVDEMNRRAMTVTFHCDSCGNFEPLQCDRKVCWCANPQNGIPYTIAVPLEAMETLPCYKRSEAGVQYYKQCDSANQRVRQIRSLLSNHGTKSFDLVEYACNYDGSYHRVQAFGEKTRCVYANNLPLTEAVNLQSADCNCAYDRHVAKLQQKEFILDCLPNGNYRSKQVWNGKTFCVDGDGFHYSDDPVDCSH